MSKEEIELRQAITKAVKKGWVTNGGFMTDVAVDEVYKMIQVKNNELLHNVSGSIKKLCFTDWMGKYTLYDENGFYIYNKDLWSIEDLEKIHYAEYLKM